MERNVKVIVCMKHCTRRKIRGLPLFEADLSDEILFTDISRDKMGSNCISRTYQLLEKVVTWSSLSQRWWNSDLCTQSVYIAEKVSVDSLQDTSQITLAKNGAPIALGGDLWQWDHCLPWPWQCHIKTCLVIFFIYDEKQEDEK